MRSGTAQTTARPVYYDRSPVTKVQLHDASYAPHGSTTRWSYTVPTGKKTLIDYLYSKVVRGGVAGAVGFASAAMAYTPASLGSMQVCFTQMYDNGLYAVKEAQVSGLGLMVAGDALVGSTGDNSTGGSIQYVMNAKFQEYEA